MSYKSEPHKLLSGSWSLLPPPDLVRPPDALLMENWRVDQAGCLRSRPGMEQVAAVPNQAPVHTLFRRGAHRYAGAGSSLYRFTGAGGQAVELASGMEGQPVGTASFQGYAWIMSPTVQGKDDGSSFTAWAPAAPTAAPLASPGAQEVRRISGFNQAEEGNAWSVRGPDGEAAELHWDADNKVEGESSLWIPLNPAGTWQAERELRADLGIDGQQRADDKCRIWVNCSDPSKIERIDLLVDINDGTFNADYYVATITPLHLSPQRWAWTCVEIYRAFDAQAALAANPEYAALQQELRELEQQEQARYEEYGYGWEQQRMEAIRERLRALAEEVQRTLAFRRVGTTPGKDWSTVAAVRIQVVASQPCDVNFDAWEFYGGLNASLEGEVFYMVTFDTADGHETNAGPASEPVRVNKQAVTLSDIPVSPDPQVTRRHIYRGGGTLGGIYRVGTIWDNSTTTFIDRLPDDQAVLCKMLETDRDPPPAARGLAGPYFGKLLAYNSPEHRNRLWWSKVNQPTCWPGAGGTEGNWEPIGDDDEEILCVTTHKRLAIIYKERSIWRLVGDPDDESAALEQTNSNVGVLGPRAVADAGSLDYFVGPGGIYAFDFDRERKISEKLDPIFKGQWTRLADGISVPPISSDPQCRRRSVLVYARDLLYFSYPEEGRPWPSVTIVYNPRTEQWVSMRTAAELGGGFTALDYDPYSDELLAANAAGQVFACGYGETDAGQAISVRYLSGYHNQGLPDHDKLYEDLVVEHDTGGEPLTVKVFWDDATQQALGSIHSRGRACSVLQINGGRGRRARNAAVLIEGDISKQAVIYGIFLHWQPEPRLARSWDSGVQDLGTDQAKEIDGLELDVEATGELSWSLYGDLPDGKLSLRSSGTIAGTGERSTLRRTFGLVEARSLRLYLSADKPFRLYGVRLRARPIGEWFDGARGEFWESGELSYAPG